MHFQIYIPGAKDLAPELATVGLGDFVQGAEVLRCEGGPDAKGGAIFAWWGGVNARNRQIGYRPSEQTWRKSSDGYWVGSWNGAPSTPEELARPYQDPGKFLKLGDGNQWLIPQVERLDRNLVLADDGTWRYEAQRRHHKLWLDSVMWAQRFLPTQDGKSSVDLNMTELSDFVIGVLRMNYRVTREVVSDLGLFSIKSMAEAFSAIVGFDVAVQGV